MTLAVVVALCGGAGAVARYLTDATVQRRVSGVFPWGTSVVNVAGSLVLGFVTGMLWYHGASAQVDAVLGTGFCGGLTTWSTASWESVRLVEGGFYREAMAYTLGGLVVAALAAALGVVLASL
jgi:CrcB protein